MTAPLPELPRYLQSLWGVEGPRRGPKPKFTVSDIGDAAVAVADADGLEAVSMKAIADKLGMTTMSLYRYVDAKEDIYALMIESANTAPEPGLAGHGTWRTRLGAWATALADRYRGQPWLTQIPMTRPPAGPNTLIWTETGMAAFDDTGLSDQQKLSSLLLTDGFLRNHVRMAAELGALGRGDAPTGPDSYGTVLARVIDEATYPRLTRATRTEVLDGGPDGTDDFYRSELAFGLTIVFDGIAAQVAAAEPV